ncbi:UNVERIFIED_CONTAM: hypothetical protein K2H54_008657 [Gekko kuhli]
MRRFLDQLDMDWNVLGTSGLDPLSPPKAIGTETAARREPKQNDDELDPTCAAATWKIVRDKLPRAQPPNTRL